jgi:NADH/NAD ratio-sensing transcriptional regulator Rex
MEELFNLNEKLRKYERIIIYGAGAAGRGVLLKLLQRNIKVEYFADTDPEICGKKYLNIPIVHIDELSESESTAVIVAGAYAFAVAAELEKRGFGNIFYDYGNEVNIVHLEREER